MERVPGGRHCARCDRDVVDLTVLTRKQAAREVRARRGQLCVRMAVDPERGEPIFRPEPRRVGGAGAVAVLAGALLGCDPAPAPARPIAEPAAAAPMLPLPLEPSTEPSPEPSTEPSTDPSLEPSTEPEPVAVAPAIRDAEPVVPTAEQRALTRRKRRAALAASAPAPVPAAAPVVWMGDYID